MTAPQPKVAGRPPQQRIVWRIGRQLGPGLITGAADDDPSGIGTYSQAGAQLGFSIGWLMIMTYPLLAAIQQISARIGRTTGHGIAGNVRRHYPRWLLYSVVTLLFVANTINIGADLRAMGDAARLLIGGPAALYIVLLGTICVLGIVLTTYTRYVAVLKWLTLSLLAYVAAMFAANVPWGTAVVSMLVPHVQWNAGFFTTVLAIFGTTISPYLFFWQAAQEVEDQRAHRFERLTDAPEQAPAAFSRIRADTLMGMALSNLIALAIIFTTAATLHQAGITNVESSTQAAEALRPIAGNFAFAVFALGVIGTGLLAVPVLAGSAAHALGEACNVPVGLCRKPNTTVAFYLALGAPAVLGMVSTLTPLDPMRALYWSAVINGIVAVPVMTVMMLMTARPDVMGQFIICGWLRWLGWSATGVMAACVAGMVVGWVG